MKRMALDSGRSQKIWGRHWDEWRMADRTNGQEGTILCRFEDTEFVNIEELFGGRKIWTLLKGELHLIMRDEEGKTIVLMKITVKDSGFVFPVDCLDSLAYSVEAVCVGNTELCYIPETISGQIYQECVSVRKWQLQNYMKIFTKLLELINDLSFLSLKERLKKKLYEYCCLYQTDTIPVTHEQLANELATSREVVSRLLKKLEVEKVIVIKRKCIQVLGFSDEDGKKQKARMVS